MANLNRFHASYFDADKDLKEIHLVEKTQKGFKSLNGATNEARKSSGEVITVKREDVGDILAEMQKERESADATSGRKKK